MRKTKRLWTAAFCLLIAAPLQMVMAQEDADSTAAAQEAELNADSALPEVWDLQACINYALQQNITVRKNRLSRESAEVDLKTAKADLFPSLSASVSQRFVNRPKNESSTIIDGDNITSTTSKTTYNGSYGIDLNWTLYSGNTRLNTIKQQRLNGQISDLTVDESENSIQEQIAQLYVQILYTAEAVTVNEETLVASTADRDRGLERYKIGDISKVDLAQLESQVAQDNYNVVNAQATLQDYKLQLKQLLELTGEYEMNLYIPVLDDSSVLVPLPSKSDVYQAALAVRPEIQSAQLSIDVADLDIKIARGGYLPTLSFTAGIGTSHTNSSDYTFSEQIKQNWDNSFGLSLSIPIYSKRQTRSSIEKAKIQKLSSELDLIDEQKTLYKTIEGFWLDANSAQQQYAAAVAQVESSQLSYELVQQQFDLGMKNTIELLTEKNTLLSAKQQMLQAKYTAILSMQLLNFYQGLNINL